MKNDIELKFQVTDVKLVLRPGPDGVFAVDLENVGLVLATEVRGGLYLTESTGRAGVDEMIRLLASTYVMMCQETNNRGTFPALRLSQSFVMPGTLDVTNLPA